MEMNQDTLKALLDAFDASDWHEMIVTIGEDRLHVSRDALPPEATAAPPAPSPPAATAAPAATPAPAPPPATAPAAPAPPPAAGAGAAAPVEADGTPVTAPSVGLFWRAPSPGAPPFTDVGQRVEAGDTIGIVEVMKLMNHVSAGVAGVVTAIPVANGETVEFGQTLVVIDPEG